MNSVLFVFLTIFSMLSPISAVWLRTTVTQLDFNVNCLKFIRCDSARSVFTLTQRPRNSRGGQSESWPVMPTEHSKTVAFHWRETDDIEVELGIVESIDQSSKSMTEKCDSRIVRVDRAVSSYSVAGTCFTAFVEVQTQQTPPWGVPTQKNSDGSLKPEAIVAQLMAHIDNPVVYMPLVVVALLACCTLCSCLYCCVRLVAHKHIIYTPCTTPSGSKRPLVTPSPTHETNGSYFNSGFQRKNNIGTLATHHTGFAHYDSSHATQLSRPRSNYEIPRRHHEFVVPATPESRVSTPSLSSAEEMAQIV